MIEIVLKIHKPLDLPFFIWVETLVLLGKRTDPDGDFDGLFGIFLFEHNLNYTPLLITLILLIILICK